MVQSSGRWIDSIWLNEDSANERRDSLMDQFERLGLKPVAHGLCAWIVTATVEDASLAGVTK